MILVISDIHLGAPVCQAELTLKLLEEEEYDTLIICGDLLDSYHLHRLCKKQWKVLSTLRKISKNKECIFIKGNHDQHIETITALLGFEFYEEFIKTIGDKKILFVHGDRWDHFVMAKPILTSIASFFYHLLQLFDSKQKLSRKLKRILKLGTIQPIHSWSVSLSIASNTNIMQYALVIHTSLKNIFITA